MIEVASEGEAARGDRSFLKPKVAPRRSKMVHKWSQNRFKIKEKIYQKIDTVFYRFLNRFSMIFEISPGSGNLDSFCLENIFFPSTATSKSPLLPETSSDSIPYFFNSAARPTAFGS